MANYRPRIADKLLSLKLEGKGAVLIEGAKWCGKTTTAEQIAKSILYMSDPTKMEQNLELAGINPQILLDGKKPRLIDEWQIAPKLWDAIRFNVDHSHALGEYILTGSCVPADTSKIVHTGTGRIGRLKMRTMSLWESGDSLGSISLKKIFDNPESQNAGAAQINLPKLAFLTCRGGWPKAIDMRDEIALDQAFDYLQAVETFDIQRADGVERDPARVHKFLRAYARNQASQASIATLRDDMLNNEGEKLSADTVSQYVKALKRIFVIEEAEAWNPNLRSKTAIRTTDTRYFTDPSIATAALGLGPNDLINDLNTFGLIFETLCMRDLRIYAEACKGSVYHYRDKNNLECDAVVHLRDGRYGLIEIKLGGERLIEEGVRTLNELAAKIDTTKMKEPSFKMVLTGVGDYAFRRKDNIWIVPIGALKD